ncbi:NUDIX hydrolase [Candidatus Albibeggiatoa sp. nov. NOAA]|uniref:NUDIX hydrolase n=1 Tax=Candidatus Albibeggiatoa sp. nov. NOAA TaxID=3162724 RepID=UPI0032FAB207|nr:NUDIX hydrolase [Thiotrichaceae bacterium]
MKFCSTCGSARIEWKVPEGDNMPRYVCEDCQTIHYQNPKIVTGCLPEWENKILLCKRAIEPRYGLWTLPAGFMENNETIAQAAMRETWEEAQAKVENVQLYVVISLPYINQVYMMFKASMSAPEFGAGVESLEVDLFTEQQIPWDELAFPVIKKTLEYYYADRKTGQFPLHVSDILHRVRR